MVTEEHVLRGQVLVQVPSAVMMTWETAKQSPHCGKVVTEAGLTEWQVRRAACRLHGPGSSCAPLVRRGLNTAVPRLNPGCCQRAASARMRPQLHEAPDKAAQTA